VCDTSKVLALTNASGVRAHETSCRSALSVRPIQLRPLPDAALPTSSVVTLICDDGFADAQAAAGELAIASDVMMASWIRATANTPILSFLLDPEEPT
jgi:hypothetical protein